MCSEGIVSFYKGNCGTRFWIFSGEPRRWFFLLPLYLKRILTFVAKTCWKSERGEGLSKTEFKELLSVATKESYFIFNGKFNKQAHSVDMGSPLSLTLTNSFIL